MSICPVLSKMISEMSQGITTRKAILVTIEIYAGLLNNLLFVTYLIYLQKGQYQQLYHRLKHLDQLL